MRRIAILCAIVAVFAFSWPALAASVVVMGGTAWSLPTPLVIRQDGKESIVIPSARWETRPLYESPYYSVRFAGSLWAFEIIHHKLYLLDGTHPDVQQFWISHGYNLILAERLYHAGDWSYSLGGGVVLAHPETVVRGQELSDPPHAEISFTGFYLSGVAAHVSVARKVPVLTWLSLVAEAKLTGAWARVPVAGGHADVPNVAVHAVIGAQVTW